MLMRAMLLSSVLLVAFGSILMADDKADEWKALKGTWTVDKAVLQGQDQTDAFKSAILTMDEGKYTVQFAGQEDKGTIGLMLTKKPKQMNIESTEGPNQGKKIPAIYELEGDTLKTRWKGPTIQPPWNRRKARRRCSWCINGRSDAIGGCAMAQLIVELSESDLELLNAEAEAAGQSASQVAARVLRESLRGTSSPCVPNQNQLQCALDESIRENDEVYRRLAQ
jgi:uncharacterized protein (TIGR03067 family)